MICQLCGVEAPTRHVAFHQNIGLLVMRFHRKTEGNLCKPCVHKAFWTATGVNLVLGWWGIISMIFTPIFLVMNTVAYVGALDMESPSLDARKPELTGDAVEKLKPHLPAIIDRLKRNESLDTVSAAIAPQAGVTPAQVALYVAALARASKG